mmetsp:Transcript_17502/g.51045  ORF Transcript_17502/g.51045 Transcript_17502/m.51045 type:complete len:139 (+) Transcript_17502:155-571(+)
MSNDSPEIKLPSSLCSHQLDVLNSSNSGHAPMFPECTNTSLETEIRHFRITTNVIMGALMLQQSTEVLSVLLEKVLNVSFWKGRSSGESKVVLQDAIFFPTVHCICVYSIVFVSATKEQMACTRTVTVSHRFNGMFPV